MNTCIKKYFGKEITNKEIKNILKNMLFTSVKELKDLKKSKEIPACIIMYIQALERDMKRGSIDTVESTLDCVFPDDTSERI